MKANSHKSPDKNPTHSTRETTFDASSGQGVQFDDRRKDTSELVQLQQKANSFTSKDGSPPNYTGLPDNLKSGIENLSGISMDDVKVHRNSDEPAQLNAHAYAQGNQIHLGPGQEKHLPHEAWHVVQQKQGRVKPTKQLKGKTKINDDEGLEREADIMGSKAYQLSLNKSTQPQANNSSALLHTSADYSENSGSYAHKSSFSFSNMPVQRKVIVNGHELKQVKVGGAFKLQDLKGGAFVNKPDPGGRSNAENWLSDSYKRAYKNWGEFDNHTSGNPVSFGLARKIALWYRINFIANNQFFVLGENHAAFGYHDLINESNLQNFGHVLGEGGARKMMNDDVNSPATKYAAGIKDKKGKLIETIMELKIPKAMFALDTLRETLYTNIPNITEIPEHTWFKNYNKLPLKEKGLRSKSHRPYYKKKLNADPNKTRRIYAKTKGAPAYNLFNTAKKNTDSFKNQLATYTKKLVPPLNPLLTNFKIESLAAQPFLNKISMALVAAKDLPGAQKNKVAIKAEINKAMPHVRKLAFYETEKFLGAAAPPIAAYKGNTDAEASMELRDLAMFHTIVQHHAAYFMAAMGDHHATNLKARFKKHNINVMTHAQFKQASKSAI